MDSTAMVNDLVVAGSALLTALEEAGVEVRSAFWLFESENGGWRLVLSMPLVDREGTRAAYEAIRRVLPSDLYLRNISPVSPNDETVRLISSAVRVEGKGRTGPVRFTNNTINNVLIEDAVIYRST
jgi:hypothetical protein